MNFFKRRNQLDTLYLHIGFHKTGTSYLQQTLFKNRQLLEENSISFVCREDYERNMDAGNAMYYLRRLPRLEQVLKKSHPVAIVSSEDISMLEREEIHALQTLLQRYVKKVKVIAYLRNHDEYAVSMKQQGAKTRSLGKVFGHEAGLLPKLTDEVEYLLNYSNRLALWAELFGKENLHITSFDYLKKNDIDLLDDFLEETSLTHLPLESIGRTNESIGYYWQVYLHRHQHLWWANNKVRSHLLPALLEASSGSERKYLNHSEIESFREHFSEDIERTAAYSKGKVLLDESMPKERPFTFEKKQYKATCQQFIAIHRKTVDQMHSQKTLTKGEISHLAEVFRQTSPSYAKHLTNLVS